MIDNEQLTTDEKLLRLADMIDWLLFNNVVASRRELAKRMKYQESTLSLVVNGKQPISPKFLTALAGVDDRLNVDWINSGEGDMILEVEEDTVVPSQEEIALLMRQQEAVKMAQQQLSDAFKLGNEHIILAQQAIVQKESDTLDTMAVAFKLSKEKMLAIIGNNNSGNYLNSPNSGNQNSLNGRQRTKRYIRKKPGGA